MSRFSQNDHLNAPYAEAVASVAAGLAARACVPGHIGDPSGGLGGYFGTEILARDIPPLTDGVDAPVGTRTALKQACALAADAWGAEQTWFLTGGASQGNITTALALRHLGQEVVVARTMHSSALDGIVMAGIEPETIMPTVDRSRGIVSPITPDQLGESLSKNSGAAAAWVVSPTYFGAVADIENLAKVAHWHGVPLIVDEAWGAHFGFHPDLPVNALRLGADLVVSSTHKLGGSLGQSAMLHLGHGPFAQKLKPLIEKSLKATSSTSESSLLLASLDLARKDLKTRPNIIGDSIEAMDVLRSSLRGDERFFVVDDQLTATSGTVASDPLRVVVDVSKTGMTGHEVKSFLFHKHGIYAEMSTSRVVVFLSGACSPVDSGRVFSAMDCLPFSGEGDEAFSVFALPDPGVRVMPLRDAYFSDSVLMPAREAVGRVSASMLAAYPPGIPNILPGEVITEEAVAFLQATAASPHGYVRGADFTAVTSLRVVA